MNVAGMLNHTAQYVAVTEAAQASGAFSITDAAAVTIRCSLQPRASSESYGRSREEGIVNAVLYTTNGTLVENGKVVHGSRTYRIVGPARDIGSRGVFYTYDLEYQGPENAS